MAIFLLDIMGSPNIGVYTLATDTYTIVPAKVPDTKVKKIRECLNTEIIFTNIGGSRLIGALVAANSNGIVVPYYTHDEEIERVRSVVDINIERIPSRKTALGNLVLANDHGAIADPRLSREGNAIKMIQDTLGVEVVPGEIAGLPYVGSIAVATNKGVLTHPMLKEEEKEILHDALKVPVDVGTVNCGVPFVASGLIANRYGAIAGSVTTGPEIVIIGEVLGAVI